MREGKNTMTQKLRFKNLEKFGFGPNVMKKNKVCPRCARLVGARLSVCPDCNEKLSIETLFDRYKRWHLSCDVCDTVLAPDSRFCSNCGAAVKKNTEPYAARIKAVPPAETIGG